MSYNGLFNSELRFISVIGVAILLEPTSGIIEVSMIIGLGAGLFASIATVLLRTVGKNNTPNQMMFYYFLFCSILGLIAGIAEWHPITGYQWIILLLIGLLGVLYQFGLTYTLQYTQVRIISPLLLITVLFSGLLDWGLRDILPDTNFLVGGSVLIFGIIWVIITGSRTAQKD